MHPVLCRVALFGETRAVSSYGALVLLGLVAGVLVAVARARRFGLARFDVFAIGLLAVGGGLLGGAATYVLVHLPTFLDDWRRLRSPGMVFYGGLAGGVAAAALYCRAYGVSLRVAGDVAAPGLALGHALGRIGCLLGGCCYGRVSDGSWFTIELDGVHRHAVQLYEAAGLGCLGLALLVAHRFLRRPGAVLALYLGAYAVLRITLEHWRGDDLERGSLAGLSTSQALALVCIAGALYLARSGATCRGATRARRPV